MAGFDLDWPILTVASVACMQPKEKGVDSLGLDQVRGSQLLKDAAMTSLRETHEALTFSSPKLFGPR